MTYRPVHGHHGPVRRARARLACWLDRLCGRDYVEWDGRDDHGNHVGDVFGGEDYARPARLRPVTEAEEAGNDWPADDGRIVVEAVHDAEAAEAERRFWGEHYGQPGEPGEDVRGPAEPLPGPAHFHDDRPAGTRQAVLLRDGTLLMKTPGEPHAYDPREIDDTLIDFRPEPRSGASAWAAQLRHTRRTWVDELVLDCLGAPTVEMYLWGWRQRRAIAA